MTTYEYFKRCFKTYTTEDEGDLPTKTIRIFGTGPVLGLPGPGQCSGEKEGDLIGSPWYSRVPAGNERWEPQGLSPFFFLGQSLEPKRQRRASSSKIGASSPLEPFWRAL